MESALREIVRTLRLRAIFLIDRVCFIVLTPSPPIPKGAEGYICDLQEKLYCEEKAFACLFVF